MQPTARPELSVVMTFDDHGMHIAEMVDAVAAQSLAASRFEVLVVQAGNVGESATADFERWAEGRIQYRTFRIAAPGRAAGYNFGVRASRANLVLFLADDFIPERYCFEAHVRFHDGYPEEHYVGVGPAFFSERLRRDPFRRWLEDSGELFGTSFTHLQPEVVQSYFYGANTSLKRSFIDRVGGFDENFRYHTTDDYEFGVRARKFGMKAVFLPDARAIHEHDVNLAERAASVRRSGSSNVWLERKHPDLPPPSAHYRRTAWRYRLRSWRAWLRYLRTGADADLVASWRSWIMSAGVAGYAAARAKNG